MTQWVDPLLTEPISNRIDDWSKYNNIDFMDRPYDITVHARILLENNHNDQDAHKINHSCENWTSSTDEQWLDRFS